MSDQARNLTQSSAKQFGFYAHHGNFKNNLRGYKKIFLDLRDLKYCLPCFAKTLKC